MLLRRAEHWGRESNKCRQNLQSLLSWICHIKKLASGSESLSRYHAEGSARVGEGFTGIINKALMG